MRNIGDIDDKTRAQVFCSHLYISGIPNQAEANPDGTWQIWIHSEDHLDEARKQLQLFLSDPDHPKYAEALKEAARKKLQEKKEATQSKSRKIDIRTKWTNAYLYRIGSFTLILIVTSVIVAIATRLGAQESAMMNALRITEVLEGGRYFTNLPEIQNGQIWRLLTPIFIHFGPIHLIFNMLWLKDLGSMIEHVQGSRRLVFLVVTIGILSNLGQFYITDPAFGGMSGVVYGLLGYIWIRSKFDPNSGLYLHKAIVIMMMIWFFVCLFGFAGPVANAAHGVGLVVGMAWGFLSSGRLKIFRK
ncbi:MAG: rhomboid family intramembrane serine protease [Planctomycetota bacterium]